MSHESKGKTNEWYTPKYIFDALECEFDLDVASPEDLTHTHVPALRHINSDSLNKVWNGFIWMNPPYGDKKVKEAWLKKFFDHGDGIALLPDRTSASWWQHAAPKADSILFIDGRVNFIKPDGSIGMQPSNGTTLFAIGKNGVEGLLNAHKNGLGKLFYPYPVK